jgi:ribosomal protein S12 methylthiotransferase
LKIGFVSLGCPKNLVDSEVMVGFAERAGHSITPDPSEAEVLVVNTCAFIDSAKKESVDAILEMAEHKKAGRCRRLIVTGCLGERYREELRRELPEVDAVLGTNEVPDIVRAIEDRAAAVPLVFHRSNGGQVAGGGQGATLAPARDAASALPSYLYDAETPRTLSTPRHIAYVKIAEGCDYKCSFCIIPRLRGHYRSRPADSIVREARALASRGVRELLLVSQDTTFYGVDRGERGALARLLRDLDAVEGLDWIRLLYLYPTTVTSDTLQAIADCGKVCRYVDLPLQHASDPVLKRMRRPGTRASYERLLAKIRRTVPGVAIRTTFIVGFPGETREDFERLCAFVEDQRFDHVGVFTYSHEEGTTAGAMEDDVPGREKAARRGRLMATQKRIVGAANRARVGATVRVLVDGPSPEHPFVSRGRLESQAPDIDSAVYLSGMEPEACRPGHFIEGRVLAARGYDLVVGPATGSRPTARRGPPSPAPRERPRVVVR